MKRATVSWWNASPGKGYGFLKMRDGSADVFAHYSAVDGLKPEAALREGEPVYVEVVDGPKGPQASRVIRCRLTVADLCDLLRSCPADATVHLAVDPEGNSYRFLQGVDNDNDPGRVILWPGEYSSEGDL